MSYYIVIRGPLGSGKTTLSKELSDRLNAKHIRIDKILDALDVNEIDEDEGCIPIRNFIQANEDIIPHAKAQLQNEKIIIFDACFYHQEVLDHLLHALPFPHHVFTLKTTVNTCISRDKERNLSYGEEAAKAVHALVSRFDYGINIDPSGSIDEAVDEIMSHLPKP